MKPIITALLLVCLLSTAVYAQQKKDTGAEIIALMNQSAKDWNNSDLNAFMALLIAAPASCSAPGR